jgi:signal peptidase I
MIRKFFSYAAELIKVIAISLAIIIPVRYLLIQPFYVKGASMEPNFHDNEYLIIDEITYRFEQPKRGEIVIFRYPRDPQEYFIKRIIGLPGEKVEIKDGGVYIYNQDNPDGFLLEENYLPLGLKTSGNFINGPVELGQNEYFVLGDNRNSSKDSRVFGPVDKSFITGRVFLRGWPIKKIGIFKTPEYKD